MKDFLDKWLKGVKWWEMIATAATFSSGITGFAFTQFQISPPGLWYIGGAVFIVACVVFFMNPKTYEWAKDHADNQLLKDGTEKFTELAKKEWEKKVRAEVEAEVAAKVRTAVGNVLPAGGGEGIPVYNFSVPTTTTPPKDEDI